MPDALRAVVFAEMCQPSGAGGVRHKAVGWLFTHIKQPKRTTAFCWQHTANRWGKWKQANCCKKGRLVWANPQTSAVLIHFSPWATHSCQNKDWQPGEGTQAVTQQWRTRVKPTFLVTTSFRMGPFLECSACSPVVQTLHSKGTDQSPNGRSTLALWYWPLYTFKSKSH